MKLLLICALVVACVILQWPTFPMIYFWICYAILTAAIIWTVA